jgi:hypothetical protein
MMYEIQISGSCCWSLLELDGILSPGLSLIPAPTFWTLASSKGQPISAQESRAFII